MSFSRSIRLVRQLSTTTTTNPTSSISISKAKFKLRAEHDPDKALQIYSSVSDHYTSPVSSRYAQELTVQRLAKARRFSDIEALIESHKKTPQITQEPFLCSLIRCYGKAGMFDHALNTFNQMDELGTPRTTLSFNALLAACNHSKLYDNVPQLFDEMPKRHGFVPNEVSYGILIRSFCRKGDPELALKTLEEMEEKGVEVTAVAFTTIYDAFCKKGMSDEAERIWNEMVNKGCLVDAAAYNVRIGNAYGGKPEDVMRLIEDMAAAGLKPDAISYNYLSTCYCRNGRMDEAMKLYLELDASGFKPKAATFRTLIHYLCKNEEFGKGYDVFKRSVFHNKIPDFATLKVLVEGLVAKNNKKDAKGLIRTVKKKFPPNVLNAWKKIEVELGLVSQESAATMPEVKEAAK
ncbi:pentatricopeptide repeat-containing protein At4g36680, mitochondrial-like [Chenopodium quinoa]|uniref:Uncharacterized protein n=1 Tax=Chenopodium quinoa TaxID=63459 RepID=A0A803L809_CHEQI|nr:pentatricopeptide repeat-containing protein At4g36680, mitochondrial-like [Chenopodium quinoa]